jgi:hypothetical protein
MAINLDTLETDIELATVGNGKPVLKAPGGDFTGIPMEQVPHNGCAILKWCHQNSGYRFKPFFELDYETPYVGMRVYDAQDKVVKTIKRVATGGDNGDPTKQISHDMYTIIGKAAEFVKAKAV